ncbi:MAG: lysophospholipid acyltransferase family protein [Eubacteriales bacterium]|nr:lysophospholipid acyltransferase family protein [Eubacteriales bacterium]
MVLNCIRTGIVLLFVILFLIVSIPVYFVFWLIGRISPETKDKASFHWVRGAFHVILFLAGTRVTAIGEEKIPRDRAVLYIGNHRSLLDIVITYVRVPGLTGYLAKNQLAKIPLLRGWAKNIHCLFLDREDIRQGLQTILAAIELIKSGISVFVFPEGTRNHVEGTLLPFHAGSFKIALKSGCPIVPVTIVGAGDLLEDHWPGCKAAHVVVEFGDPIDTLSLSAEEKKRIPERVRELIAQTYEKNKGMI